MSEAKQKVIEAAQYFPPRIKAKILVLNLEVEDIFSFEVRVREIALDIHISEMLYQELLKLPSIGPSRACRISSRDNLDTLITWPKTISKLMNEPQSFLYEEPESVLLHRIFKFAHEKEHVCGPLFTMGAVKEVRKWVTTFLPKELYATSR